VSDLPFMECPICHKNYHQSFECDHDEDDLVERIAALEAALIEAERDWEQERRNFRELQATIRRLGSPEAFDVARSIDKDRDAELVARMDYANEALGEAK